MTDAEAWALIERYRVMKGKGTPAEYMAYMWARKQVKDNLSSGQRGFLEAASKLSAPPATSPEIVVKTAPASDFCELVDAPSWATENIA